MKRVLQWWRSRKNRHTWVEREPLDTPHGILRQDGRAWRTDYECSRCGAFPRCPSDFFDILVAPPREGGCTALPLPSVPALPTGAYRHAWRWEWDDTGYHAGYCPQCDTWCNTEAIRQKDGSYAPRFLGPEWGCSVPPLPVPCAGTTLAPALPVTCEAENAR